MAGWLAELGHGKGVKIQWAGPRRRRKKEVTIFSLLPVKLDVHSMYGAEVAAAGAPPPHRQPSKQSTGSVEISFRKSLFLKDVESAEDEEVEGFKC